MEIHRNCLQRLCRVCARLVKSCTGYITPKDVTNYVAVFYNVYNVSVNCESPDVFPKKLCSNCNRKLSKLAKDGNMSVKYECYDFVPHTDDCPICFKKSLKLATQSKSFHLRNFDEIMRNCGFLKENERIGFLRIYFKLDLNENIISNKISFYIDFNQEWKIQIYQKTFNSTDLDVLQTLPQIINDDNSNQFKSFFENLRLCEGINGFDDVIMSKLDFKNPIFASDKGEMIAIPEDVNKNQLIKENFKIIRHVKCKYISDKGSLKCSVCSMYTSTLRSMRSRLKSKLEPEKKKQRVSDTSTINVRYLSRDELEKKLDNIQKEKREALKKIARLSKIIRENPITRDGFICYGEGEDENGATTSENVNRTLVVNASPQLRQETAFLGFSISSEDNRKEVPVFKKDGLIFYGEGGDEIGVTTFDSVNRTLINTSPDLHQRSTGFSGYTISYEDHCKEAPVYKKSNIVCTPTFNFIKTEESDELI